jgi:hypothetical protein
MKHGSLLHLRLLRTYMSLFQEGYKLYCGQMVAHLRINPLNAELNPICHLLALSGGATIVVVSG